VLIFISQAFVLFLVVCHGSVVLAVFLFYFLSQQGQELAGNDVRGNLCIRHVCLTHAYTCTHTHIHTYTHTHTDKH
jgi:hypothetical protein